MILQVATLMLNQVDNGKIVDEAVGVTVGAGIDTEGVRGAEAIGERVWKGTI